MACRNRELAEEARQKVTQNDPEALKKISVMELDLQNSTSINNFVGELQQRNYSCDVLLNNAGIAIIGDKLNETTARSMMATNFYGPT